jgi:predicted anti-sigma-YlaC factor YlaD
MNCKYFEELISARFDGELSKEEDGLLTEHMTNCSDCRQFAADINELSSDFGQLVKEKLPAEAEQKVLSSIDIYGNKKPARIRILQGSYTISKRLAWATAILLLLLAINTGRGLLENVPTDKLRETGASEQSIVQRVAITEQDLKKTDSYSARHIKN